MRGVVGRITTSSMPTTVPHSVQTHMREPSPHDLRRNSGANGDSIKREHNDALRRATTRSHKVKVVSRSKESICTQPEGVLCPDQSMGNEIRRSWILLAVGGGSRGEPRKKKKVSKPILFLGGLLKDAWLI